VGCGFGILQTRSDNGSLISTGQIRIRIVGKSKERLSGSTGRR
jgi:hypothetical protein